MYENVLALILLTLSVLPNFPNKIKIENSLKNEFSLKQETTVSNVRSAKVIPEKSTPAEVTAQANSAHFIDRETGEILFSKNAEKKLPMASTTKLMTAIIAEKQLKINEVITVPTITTRPLDSVVGFAAGDKVTVSELLHGLLIESGSDAALTLSSRIAGSEENFAAMMNEEAKILGLSDTQFTNSVGYDDNNHYSTAKDLTKLARIALSNKTIAEIVNKKSHTLRTENGKNFYLSNTNKLLSSNYKGIKTGTTYAAGECLISLYSDGQREIIGVILGSPDRFYETRNIIDWATQNFKW